MTRRRAVALAVAVMALAALGVARAGGGGPTIYDGICGPVQYRYLGGNPAPASVTGTYTAAQLGQTQTLADDQSAPQAQLIVGAGTLTPPPGASTVTISITPVKPPSTRPAGRIDGNVYQFKAESGSTEVPAAADHPVTIVLGGTSSSGNLTLERFDGTRWSALRTFPSNCGSTYDAAAPGFGLFALVGAASSGATSGGGVSPLLFVLIVVVLLAAVIVAIRVSRTRRRAPRGRRGGSRRR